MKRKRGCWCDNQIIFYLHTKQTETKSLYIVPKTNICNLFTPSFLPSLLPSLILSFFSLFSRYFAPFFPPSLPPSGLGTFTYSVRWVLLA